MDLTPLLDRAAAEPFAAMTYPHHVPDLLAVEPGGAVVAVGATDPDPCGLALARANPGGDAHLLSVLVKAPHRNRGVGTALVSAAQDELRRRGVAAVSGTYPAGKETTPALERVLAKCGWDAPQPSMYLYTLPPQSDRIDRSAAWLQPRPVPDGFTLLLWADVPTAAIEEVGDRVARGEIPPIVSPYMDLSGIDASVSFGLMKGDRLVGWALIHRTGPTTVRGTALYADPRQTPPGVGLQLLGRTFRQWIDRNDAGEGQTATWGIHAANPFLRVFQRRVLPSMPNHVLTLSMGCAKRLA